MIDENVDLNGVVERLRASLPQGGPEGYLSGKAVMRDLLVDHERLSQLEAEELVDTLELQGFLHFEGDPSARSDADSGWRLVPDPGPRG